ncbi:MAG: rod shape-determining protein MreC [Ignavibacteria bacterium GWB2_35_12]|nr:MAG: rod shape-determining protein MreC [Ignavibacteria bacterium GWB2_35_12]OGU95868.1 MAG: rod shape-determining protein MreC [Ignavibacteria bacterium RIFOXYA2_FULL_35_10]OGV20636.1 MAG: rod shape-determining protein MreC [Ignavibacteria bacterium RIFOXYC2_FULL_35_21]
MQGFINFVAKYKEYFTFVALVILSLSFISLGDVSRIGGFRTVVIGTVGWMQSAFTWIPKPGALQSENKSLRQLNLQLSTEATRMRNAVIENKRLRDMLKLREGNELLYVPAEVVGKNTIELRNYLTIDRGATDSVRAGMSVRNDAGLVGVVIGTTDNFALVEMIENRDIKIAAKLQRSGIDGVIVWEGGEVFELKNVPKAYDVKLGDLVLTSTFSNKYPPDVPIGRVVVIKEEPGNIFKTISVRSFVNFGALEEVFVIKYMPNPERTALIKQMDELLKLRKGYTK